MMTIREASKILGFKVRTIRQWIHDKRIKAVKPNGSNRWMISEKEINRILKEVETENADQN